MRAPPSYSLSWPEVESERTKALSSMLTSGEFTDVTIACDDDQIKAHKVVLSAASEVFQNIFRRNQHKHPLLYFFGVTKQQMEAVLDFIYSGDTKVPMEELDTFLNIAKSLQIKGLVGSHSDQDDSNTLEENKTLDSTTNSFEFPNLDESRIMHEKSEALVHEDKHEEEEANISHQKNIISKPSMIEYSSGVTTLKVDDLKNENNQELDQRVNSLLVKSDTGSWSCKECSYAAVKKSHVKEHVEEHITGFSHYCKVCSKTYYKRVNLRMHQNKCLKKLEFMK